MEKLWWDCCARLRDELRGGVSRGGVMRGGVGRGFIGVGVVIIFGGCFVGSRYTKFLYEKTGPHF
jgi:hypothetical protein